MARFSKDDWLGVPGGIRPTAAAVRSYSCSTGFVQAVSKTCWKKALARLRIIKFYEFLV